jgi:hypothetical protein
MKDKEREDPQPDHGNGPPPGKGRPVDKGPEDHGRPVTPHRSSAQIFNSSTEKS